MEMVERNCGMEMVGWNCGMEMVEWIGGIEWWHGCYFTNNMHTPVPQSLVLVYIVHSTDLQVY